MKARQTQYIVSMVALLNSCECQQDMNPIPEVEVLGEEQDNQGESTIKNAINFIKEKMDNSLLFYHNDFFASRDLSLVLLFFLLPHLV
jgi:hypothetical protein